MSVNSAGAQGISDSYHPALSANGRYIAFQSYATNLVAGDTNGSWDIFVYDRQTGQTSLVSVGSGGVQGNDGSYVPTISGDGRFVAFSSWASNLIAEDTNSTADIFVHDWQTGQTSLISVGSDGAQGNRDSNNPFISADGRYVVFYSSASNFVPMDIDGRTDVFLRDRQTDITTCVSVSSNGTLGNNTSSYPAISSDGRYVAFYSSASNLVSGDTNGQGDVFVHDRQISEPPPDPAIYLSPTGIGKLGVQSFTGADILSYTKTTNTWDVFYDGSYVKTAKNVSTFAFQSTDILLGFSVIQAITGLGTVAPQDLVRFTPITFGYNNTVGTFDWFFDGSDVGLTTSAEAIDALWIDATGQLYISTTGTAKVPDSSGAVITAHDEDVLRFTPASTGPTTSGTWALYWDPTGMTGMSAEDINGYWEDPMTGHRYVTILGAFTFGNTAYGGKFTGNGKTILRFAPNAAAPGGWAPVEKVIWLAAGATFASNIDGIEMSH